jgi:2'-5' RNA ligase
MPWAVTARLDPAGAARVSGMWDALAALEYSTLPDLGYVPHITLAVLDDDASGLAEAVRHVTAAWRVMPVSFAGIGVFPGPPAAVWLAPVPDGTLLAAQRVLCAALPGALLHPHYRPGAWVPHVTLGEDLTAEQAGGAVSCLMQGWQPLATVLDRVDLVRFRPVSVTWHRALAVGADRDD